MSQPLLTLDVLDVLPNAVLCLESIRAADGSITDFRVLLANRKAEEMSRQSLAKLQTTPFFVSFPQARQTDAFTRYVGVVETGEPVQFEFRYDNQGIADWFAINATKLGDGLVLSASVITEQRQTRQYAEEQAALFAGVLDSLQNGLNVLEAIRDPTTRQLVDFKYIAVSCQSTLDTGFSREQMLADTMLTLFPGVQHSSYWPVFQRVLATQQPERFEVHYEADGFDNYLDNYVMPLGADRLLSVYYLVNDHKRTLIELQHAQAIIRNEADLFNTLSRNVPGAGVLVCNDELRVLFANGDLPDAFALPTTQLVGQLLGDVLVQEWQEAGRSYFTDALAGRSSSMTELVNTQFYEVYFGPVSRDDGPSTMAMATFRNVTEARQFQQRLETSVRELQRSNANLEQFAYVASHDLQEPLRKVQAFGDMLQSQYASQLGEVGADLIGRMQSAAARMQTLIQDLLTFSRLTTGRDSFRLVDVNQTVREVLADLEPDIARKQADIQLEDSMPKLMGDPLQLRQLFQNLLTNALKFSRPGVLPVVQLSCQEGPGRELAWTYADGTRLALADLDRSFYRIDVIDNGIGFEPQYAERIFQVFQRLHGRQQYPGTGIGLAIVQKVVDNHRGYIVAEGRPGNGATFRVLLPTETI